MAATDLYDLANELLSAVVNALDQSPGGPIARAYVSASPPLWDGVEQATVHVGQIAIADTSPLQPQLQPFHRVRTPGLVNLVPLVVTVLRACPMPVLSGEGTLLSAPDPEELASSGMAVTGDFWTIWNYLLTAVRTHHLFADPNDPTGKTREFTIDPPVPVQQMGGAAGFEMQCRVQLDGYAPVIV